MGSLSLGAFGILELKGDYSAACRIVVECIVCNSKSTSQITSDYRHVMDIEVEGTIMPPSILV